MVTKLPKSKCLHCGKELDHATSIGHEFQPHPGAITVCAFCSAVMVFGDDLQLRGFTDDEIEALKADKQLNAHHRRVGHVHSLQK